MKKCVSLLLTLAMTLSFFPAATSASETEPAVEDPAAAQTISADEQFEDSHHRAALKLDLDEPALMGAANDGIATAANTVSVSGTVTLPDATLNAALPISISTLLPFWTKTAKS